MSEVAHEPWRPDGWLAGGLLFGVALFLTAVFGFEHVPRVEALPDFEHVRVTRGQLFCTSYTGRRGADFRIDGQEFVAPFRSCDLRRDGVSGPHVEARWVELPGPPARRVLISLRRAETGEGMYLATEQDVARWLDVLARQDPLLVPRLFAAAGGILVVIASLARAHRRRMG